MKKSSACALLMFAAGLVPAAVSAQVTTANASIGGADESQQRVRVSSRDGHTRIESTDRAGSLDLEITSLGVSATARHPDGAVAFSGPLNTPEERAAAPGDVVGRADALRQQHLQRAAESAERARLMRAISPAGGGGGAGTMGEMAGGVGSATSRFVRRNADGGVEVAVVDGKKTATTTDAAGNVLFSGPFTTEEERAAAPATERARIEAAEKSAARPPAVVQR